MRLGSLTSILWGFSWEVRVREKIRNLNDRLAESGNRPLMIMVVIAMVIAELGMFAPLDAGLLSLRNQMHPHAASGQIAIVAIDDDAIAAQGEWPWPRAKIAQLVRRLDAAGARKIAFEHIFTPSSDARGSEELAAAFAALPERPIIGADVRADERKGTLRMREPDPQLAKQAILASVGFVDDGFGRIWQVDPKTRVDGRTLAGLSSALVDYNANNSTPQWIDYSLNTASIPWVSAQAVMSGQADTLLKGRRVLISSARTRVPMPGGWAVSPAVIHAAAAETMLAGRQSYIGWLPSFLLGALGAFLVWRGRRLVAHGAAVATALALLGGPIWLESRFVFGDYVAGLFLLFGMAIWRGWRSYRRGGERTNTLSGLPNLLAMRDVAATREDKVIAIRVKNYAQLAAALSQQEATLVKQIIARLKTICVTPIFHGDDGIFCWVAGPVDPQLLADQLETLANSFLHPFDVKGIKVDVGLAFGVENGGTTDIAARFASALVAADEAATAGQHWKIYDPARLDEAEWKMSLLGQMDAAIDNGEVWVAYQAKYDVRQNRITGAEALARWTHPERGSIPPDEFIPVAEANGRIDKLTYFVLDQALALAAAMAPDFNIAVNLSANMFGKAGFVSKVQDLLSRHGVCPTNLTLEVTESAAAQSEAEMLTTLTALVQLGICVSIDDYGTGYSTLEYLKKIQATELKIDRGFVGAMDRNRSDRLLVNATIKLAHSLGQKVVAEGVETKETLEMLSKMGCDKVQGYYISRPIAAPDFIDFIAERAASRAA